MGDLYPDEEFLQYEEEVLRNPYSPKLWRRYLIALADAPSEKRRVIYERSLKHLPGSYKIWHAYLQERREWLRSVPISDSRYTHLNHAFERALITMHKMPGIWSMYLQFLMKQKLVTVTRKAFDRALAALPVSQHDEIWRLYLGFIKQKGIPDETRRSVHRRCLMYDPSQVEEYIEFLKDSEKWQEAAELLGKVLNDDSFCSIKGKSKHELWLELCGLLTRHAECVSGGFDVDAVVRAGINRLASGEVGPLWIALAEYYVRKNLFEKARDVLEEGMSSVKTVRDFSVIFDSYVELEQAAMMDGDTIYDEDEDEDDDDDLDSFWLSDKVIARDFDLRLARLEGLMRRRPELVSDVKLKQNPHCVEQWHYRVKLHEGNPAKQVLTYAEAVKTVDPMKAVGNPHTLWIAFASLYEKHGEIENARLIFEKAVQVNYKAVDHLASVWHKWAEMEIRHENHEVALHLMKRATTAQMKTHKSLSLWTYYADLEGEYGSLESTREVYDKILDLRIATPQIILKYASLLADHKHFDEAFKVYERGVHMFRYPHAKDIWTTYLSTFVRRFGASKLERTRDLFENAIAAAPANAVKPLYLQYAKFEEDFGLLKRAMKIYDDATKAVTPEERLGMYETYIARVDDLFGVLKTGEIYQQAIESDLLGDKDVKVMCMRYADVEENLGRIERARALYTHASQFADPKSDPNFWFKWHGFEVAYGNEDTYGDMCRVKRSVAKSYAQTNHILQEQVQSLKADLESSVWTNKEDIELNDDCEDEEVSQKDVPSAIFGSLTGKREAGDEAVGALERIKRSRR